MFRNFGMMSADEARYHLTMGMVSSTAVPPDVFRVCFASRFRCFRERVILLLLLCTDRRHALPLDFTEPCVESDRIEMGVMVWFRCFCRALCLLLYEWLLWGVTINELAGRNGFPRSLRPFTYPSCSAWGHQRAGRFRSCRQASRYWFCSCSFDNPAGS